MIQELFLNGKLMDLQDNKITRNLQATEIGDLAKNRSSFSYTIQLPRTSTNILALDFLGIVGNKSRKPYERVGCRYVVDGVELIVNGTAIIKQTGGFYSVNLLDGIVTLSELLGDKKISDLDFSDLEHDLTIQNYLASINNTSGYTYVLSEYQEKGTTFDNPRFGFGMNLNVQAPSMFVHSIFSKIFEEAGALAIGRMFDIDPDDGNPFSSNQSYYREVMTPAKGVTVTEESLNRELSFSGLFDTISINEATPLPYILPSINIVRNGGNFPAFSSNEIRILESGYYDISGIYGAFNTDSLDRVEMTVQVNGFVRPFVELSQFERSEQREFLQVDDVLRFIIRMYPESGTVNASIRPSVRVEKLVGGFNVNPVNYFDDLTQVDFVREILERYGWIVFPSNSIGVDNVFEIKAIQDLLRESPSNIDDWSDRFVAKNNEKYTSSYAQQNLFKYKYEDQIDLPTGTYRKQSFDGVLVEDNFNIPPEKTVLNSIINIPAVRKTQQGFVVTEVAYIPIFSEEKEGKDFKFSISKIVKRNYDFEFVEIYDSSFNFDGQGVEVNRFEYDAMNFQNYVDENYGRFEELLVSYKEVEVELNLTLFDIKNIDFSRLKFFSQLGKNYYLDNIRYTPNRTARVKLIEL